MRSLPALLSLAVCLVSATSSAEETAPQAVGPFAKADYPSELPLRPLTLPASMVRVDLGVGYGNASVDTFFGSLSASAAEVSPGVAYGVTDQLEIGARVFVRGSTNSFTDEWSFGVMPMAMADYSLFDSESLDVSGRVVLGYSVDAEAVIFSFGLPLRYAIGDRLAFRVADTLIVAASGSGFALTLPVTVQAQLLSQLALELSLVPVTLADGFDGLEYSAPSTFTLGLVATPIPALDLRLATVLPVPGSSTSGVSVAAGAAYRF